MIQWVALIVVNSDHTLLTSMREIYAYHTYTDTGIVFLYIYMLLYVWYLFKLYNKWIEYIMQCLSRPNISNEHPLLLATLDPMVFFKTNYRVLHGDIHYAA